MLASLACLLVVLASCRSSRAADSVVIRNRSGDEVTVAVELAITPESRQLGLMYRDRLDAGQGMLFIFPEAAPQSFWMRNTRIPLDILFIDESHRIVRLHADTTPYSEKSLSSGAPVRFVLEVPGGFSAANGIAEGDTVDLGTLASTPVH
ncbi:MAG: DUF192 domain-containing protein [Thermodesulfobacteriota bacterium]